MIRRNLLGLILLGAVAISAPVTGCSKEKVVRVTAPPTFRGQVTILCAAVAESDVTVHVDASGHAGDVACPKDMAKVVMMQNGASVSSALNVSIIRTGDGIPVSFTFTVQPQSKSRP